MEPSNIFVLLERMLTFTSRITKQDKNLLLLRIV